ncbi:MAG: stage V sporulation protein S [Candidatus Velthaea sp.]
MIEPQRTPATSVLKVSAQSNPNSVAGALAGVLRERPAAELQAIGAGATNQAVKAIAIARSYLHGGGIDLVCVPEFTDVEIEGNVRTAIRLLVERRAIASGPNATASPVTN